MKRVLRWMGQRLIHSPLASATRQHPEAVGLLVALTFIYPLIAMAAQTYVLPTSGTDHQAEHLTNISNRDEAQRSSFSGASAPVSPTPVDGQHWYDTANNQLKSRRSGAWEILAMLGVANPWTASQSISAASSPAWSATDTTNTITVRTQANDTEGRVGTSTNHPACVETNANCRTTWDTSGNQTTGGGEVRTTNGAQHTATAACASGYTRVGLWCYDTDGGLTTLRTATSDEGPNFTTTLVGSGRKAAIIQVIANVTKDGGANTASLTACTAPGDATSTCISTHAYAALANENSQQYQMVTIRLDASGQMKTYCDTLVLPSGSASSQRCDWLLAAYLE